MQASKKIAGAQAVTAIVAVVILAITVPLLGIMLLPVVALAAAGRVLVGAAGMGGLVE